MIKGEIPKRVTLPNGRTFAARYKHVTHGHLPANIRLERPQKQRAAPRGRRRRRPQRVQQGRSLASLLKLPKKVVKT